MSPGARWAAIVAPVLMTACATPYDAARKEEGRVREEGRAPVQLATLPRAQCIKKAIAARGADPSKLTIAVDAMENVTVAPGPTGGSSPQVRFDYPVQHALVDLGFTVPWNATRASQNPARGKYMMSGGLTAYIPLSFAFTADDNLDLMVIGGEREKVVAAGKTRATATLYAGTEEEYLSFSTAESDMVFFQVKGKKTVTVANKNGWITGGIASERIEVMSSQEAALLAVLDAVFSSVSKGLGLNC